MVGLLRRRCLDQCPFSQLVRIAGFPDETDELFGLLQPGDCFVGIDGEEIFVIAFLAGVKKGVKEGCQIFGDDAGFY